MPRYEYTGQGEFYLNAGDTVLTNGDEVEFDDGPPEHFGDRFREVPQKADSGDSSEGDDESPSEEDESAENESEEVSAPFDPTELTVDELEAELEEGDFSEEELDALHDAEKEGEDDGRTTAKDAIADAKHQ